MSLVPLTSTASATGSGAGSGRAGGATKADARSGDAFAALLASPALTGTFRDGTPQRGARSSAGSSGSPAGAAGSDVVHGSGQARRADSGSVHGTATRGVAPTDGRSTASSTASSTVPGTASGTASGTAPGTDESATDVPTDGPSTADPVTDSVTDPVTDPVADPVADAAARAAADALAVLSAAQVVAAAQLVPVSPLLVSAVRSEMATQSATGSPVHALGGGSESPGGTDQPPNLALAIAPAVDGQAGGSDAPGAPNPPLNGVPHPATGTVGVQSTDHDGGPANLDGDNNAATSVTAPDGSVMVSGPQAGQSETAQGQSEPKGGQQGTDAAPADPSGRATGVEQPTPQDTTQPTSQPGQDTGNRADQQGSVRVEGLTAAPGAATNVTAAQPVMGATPVATDQAPTGQPLASYGVAEQVFGQMSRLVSRGDGTRRITMNLQPELLGDVRVVLTVRAGEVHVRLSGGDLAQQALLQGAPELHRLLDSVGAASSRIVVGENGASFQQSLGTAQDGRQAADQYLGGTAGHFGDRSDRPGDGQSHRGAGTRHGDTSARDGFNHGNVRTHLPTDPGTRTRPGVDVTM